MLSTITDTIPLERSMRDGKTDGVEKIPVLGSYNDKAPFDGYNLARRNTVRKWQKKRFFDETSHKGILKAKLITSDLELPDEIILNANKKKESEAWAHSLEALQADPSLRDIKNDIDDNSGNDASSLLNGEERHITHPSSNAHTLYIDFKVPFAYSSSTWSQENSCDKRLKLFNVLSHSHNFTAAHLKAQIANWSSEQLHVKQLPATPSQPQAFFYHIKLKQAQPHVKLSLKGIFALTNCSDDSETLGSYFL